MEKLPALPRKQCLFSCIERIKQLIISLGLSTRSFAINCGLRQNTLSNQLNGMRELSLTSIYAILLTYPTLSANWLLRGEGEMFLDTPASTGLSSDIARLEKLTNIIESLQEMIDIKNARIKDLEHELNILNQTH